MGLISSSSDVERIPINENYDDDDHDDEPFLLVEFLEFQEAEETYQLPNHEIFFQSYIASNFLL